MGAITTELAVKAYEVAKKVYLKEMTHSEGKKLLSNSYGMNAGSSQAYIRNLEHMLSGELYRRTMNEQATIVYLHQILNDFGKTIAERAMHSAIEHRRYYAGLGKGDLKYIERVCADFELLLNKDGLKESDHFEAEVNASIKMGSEARKAHLPSPGTKPGLVDRTFKIFVRNPHVVAEVLTRADGICEVCAHPAPFRKKSNNMPYLEVHHRVTLANGGDDTVQNALAICPNCHRQAHYG